MSRIKFIHETRSKRIFMSVLSACILIFSAIGLLVDKEISGFFFGVAFGGVLYILIEIIGLFLYKHFVFVGNNYVLIRINTLFFATILLDRLENVDILDTVQRIHLRGKTIEIQTLGIDERDVNQFKSLLDKLITT